MELFRNKTAALLIAAATISEEETKITTSKAPVHAWLEHSNSDRNCFLFRSYRGDGWKPDSMHLNMKAKLQSDLKKDGIEMDTDGFYVTSYDGPGVKVTNKYHELWVGGKKMV